MAWKQSFRVVHGGQGIATTSTSQEQDLGSIVQAWDSTYLTGEFIYLKGVASTVVGSFVTYNLKDCTTALLVANAIGPVAVSMSINVASSYGWYQISGTAVGKAKTGFADNAAVYGTSTAGSIDDAVVAGDRVHNAKGASAVDDPSTGLAKFELNRPHTDDIAD
tara:strand:+ start:1679 stop:2170 length:492 start_codon:yes stop_codon:yes gene_type:complete